MRKFQKLSAIVAGSAALAAIAGAQTPPQSIKDAINRAEASVQAIIKVPAAKRTFENTIGALDDVGVRLDTDTSLTIFMQNVHPDSSVRDNARAGEELLSNWLIELGKREDLYKAVMQYANTKPKLQGEQKRLLEFTLRDYKRAGMMLPVDKRKKLQELEKTMTKLGIEFEQNIADDETVVPMTAEELAGLPKSVLDRQKQALGIYLVGMDGPTFTQAMDYIDNEASRQRLWLAYKRRGGKRNIRILEKLIKTRAEASALLGYANTVDYEIETRMAKNAKNVADFYTKLRPIVRKKAQKDMDEFTAAKRAHTGKADAVLYPWDYSYYKQRLMKEKYAVDSEKVAEYFPMEAVVNGLFSITQSLYGIDFKDVTANAKALNLPIWHPDVKLYEVTDKATKEVLGHLYTDLYPRENKYNHAACWGLRARRVWGPGKVQKPLAALVCNFTKPTADKPSLLPHDEVETFFHEFGHGLHQLLTRVTYGRFSGTAVERDFVEAPSQMMENWVWNPDVLKTFTKHYQTGDPLPTELLNGMKAARTLGSGIETEHQFYYGLVDQAYHTAKGGNVDLIKTAIDLFPEIELYPKIPEIWFESSFGHLNGYEGAYYGYQWSLVYAQDMFQRFEELGVLSPEAGKYYRDKVLARGGTMDAMDMLKDYLGREPKMDAFLKHLGMAP